MITDITTDGLPKDTLTIHHVVMEHATITFLTDDALRDFLGPRTLGELESSMVICESEISPREYDLLTEMQGRPHVR